MEAIEAVFVKERVREMEDVRGSNLYSNKGFRMGYSEHDIKMGPNQKSVEQGFSSKLLEDMWSRRPSFEMNKVCIFGIKVYRDPIDDSCS
jgi:hypothetical protein